MKEGIGFNVGDFVFAKVRGYPAWPARISSIADPRPSSLKYNVYFFGTAETAALLAKEIRSYAENKDTLGKPVKRKFFKEGLEEIEREIEKIEKGEESTLGITLPGEVLEIAEGVPTVKRNIRKSKKSDESQNDTTEDENQSMKGKKRRRDDENNENEEVEKKKKKKKSEELTESPSKPEQISRSGRVIKPKKFLYDEEEEEGEKTRQKNSLSPDKKEKEKDKEQDKENSSKKQPAKEDKGKRGANSKNQRNQEMGRVMWARTKCGQMVQIKLDFDRPESFKDERARLMWERATDINARRVKSKIESGESIPVDVKQQMKLTEEEKKDMSESAVQKFNTLRIIERKRGKLRWLKLETRLVDVDVLIKTSLQKVKVDIDKALGLMDELINMPLDPLMLKKHPQVVETTKKLRQYVGNTPEWNMTGPEKSRFEAQAYKIRQKANILFNKYTALFAVPDNATFWTVFVESVNEFTSKTENMSRELVYSLIVDPSSPYFKEICEDEKADIEMKLELQRLESDSTAEGDHATEELPSSSTPEPVPN